MPIKAPWRCESRASAYAIVDADGQDVCYIERIGHPSHGSITARGRTPEELREIAGLIAAAPQLLDAFRRVACPRTVTRTLNVELLASKVLEPLTQEIVFKD